MPTMSEADLLRRNQILHDQAVAARAELSREVEASRVLTEQNRSLQADLQRLATWAGAEEVTADAIIATLEKGGAIVRDKVLGVVMSRASQTT